MAPPLGQSKVSKHSCMFCDGTGKQKVEPVAEQEEQPVKDPGRILIKHGWKIPELGGL